VHAIDSCAIELTSFRCEIEIARASELKLLELAPLDSDDAGTKFGRMRQNTSMGEEEGGE
jgi:hypothetical protein